MRRALVLGLALALLAPAAGLAYRLDHHVVPAPKIFYYNGLAAWRAAFARAVHQINSAHVGVRLVRTNIPERAPIQTAPLNHQCGRPGVEATTASFPGGFSGIYLPHGCRAVPATIIVAHELGHALGLHHENRRCALMNASGTGSNDIPTRCLGRRIDWLHHPFRPDDMAGLRRLYRNTPPKAHLKLSRPVGADRTA